MALPSLREFKNGAWLEQQHPRLAESIKNLDWGKDGIDDTEAKAIQDLLYIAVTSRSVTSALVSLTWIQDGIDNVEAGAIDWMNNIGAAEVASAVVSLGWLQDGVDGAEVRTLEELSYIANRDAQVGLSVVSLDWVEDGLEDAEVDAINWIGNIADAEVASAVVSLGWMQDGIHELDVETMKNLSYIANAGTEVGLSIVSLDWMQDGIDRHELKAIAALSHIAYQRVEVAAAVVSLDWVQDGIDDLEAGAIDWMSNIESAEVKSAIVALGWMQDGIDELDVEIMKNLSYIANAGTEVGLSIVSLDWMQDGIDRHELKAIAALSHIAYQRVEVAAAIVSLDWVQDGIDDLEAGAIDWMSNIESAEVKSAIVALGWMQDGIDELDVEIMKNLSYIANAGTEVGLSIVSLDWMQDGIDRHELKAIAALSHIAYQRVEVAAAIVSLDWVQDGIDDLEAGAIDWMSNIESAEVKSAIVALGWMQDGIDSLETRAIEAVSHLSHEHPAAALSVVGMPFMVTIEPPDISAVASLGRLAADDPETFDVVMSHEALRDGISNDKTPIVATLAVVADTNEDLIDVLLDPSRVLLERRIITLPLAGDVVLDIIRTAPGAASSIDLLEHSVRRMEEYMGAPFPTRYVSILYENAVSAGAGGANFGTHIAILPKADVDDENELDRPLIAHEVAHYYWGGNKSWIDEGGANFLEIERHFNEASRNAAASVSDPPCGYASNIAELEDLDEGIESVCEYSLGERLFVDLYLTLGDERFREGFRTLYLSSELESVGIDQVREAFRSDDGVASTVISRWYDGTEPRDLSRLDDGPVDPMLPSINGRVDEAYISTGTDGPPISDFSANGVTDWVYLTLKYSYSVSGDPREIEIDIVEYYEDGFTFGSRSAILTAEAEYIGGTRSFSVGASPSRKWAIGRYFVYVYVDDRKVAEVEYEVIP